ncbi:MAG: Ger(x)C family spore germination C-terminal domain-containing protein [Oscillospiraceae bacterium]
MTYTLYIGRRRAKRLLLLLIFPLFLSCLCGCRGSIYANYRDTAELQLVQTFGLDRGEHGFELSVSTGSGLPEQPTVRISRPDDSIIGGMEELRDYSPKNELYFAHTRYCLLGEGLARYSLAEYFDFMERSSQLRTDIVLFIAKDSTAKKIIQGSGEKSSEVTEGLSSLEREVRQRGEGYPFNCREVIRSLDEYGSALVCAVRASETKGALLTDSGDILPTSDGYAVLRGDKLCGFLDPRSAVGVNILIGKPIYTSITFPDGEGGDATVYLSRGDAKISGAWSEDGTLSKIITEVSIVAEPGELQSPQTRLDADYLAKLNAALEREMTSRFTRVLRFSQDKEADFLGLYGILRRSSPREISNLQEPFPAALAKAELVVRVSCEISPAMSLKDSGEEDR